MTQMPGHLKAAIAKLDALPAMPVVAQKILALQLDTDEGEQTLLKLIGQDPQISAKLVGLANTPLFGASKKVASISDAAMLLGLTRVKSVAVGIAVMSTLTRQPQGKLKVQDLWLHSMGVALAIRVLARAMPLRTRPLDDEIFLAGLLHDIGYLVLNFVDPVLSDQLIDRMAAQPEAPIEELDKELVGIGHGELGAMLAAHWELPESVVAVLRYHHHPDEEDAALGQPLVGLVNLAERLLPNFGIAEHVAADVSESEWQSFGIDPGRAEELTAAIQEQAEQSRQIASMLG